MSAHFQTASPHKDSWRCTLLYTQNVCEEWRGEKKKKAWKRAPHLMFSPPGKWTVQANCRFWKSYTSPACLLACGKKTEHQTEPHAHTWRTCPHRKAPARRWISSQELVALLTKRSATAPTWTHRVLTFVQ